MTTEQEEFQNWYNTHLQIGPMLHKSNLPHGFNDRFDMVINVCDFSNLNYAQQFTQSGLHYYWFPLNEIHKEIGLNSIYASLWMLMQAYEKRLSVYLHCFSGRNRSKLIGALLYWMMTEKDLDAPTYGARNRHDNSEASAIKYNNRFHYNCEIGVIPNEDDMKSWLLYLRETFKNGYEIDSIGIIDYSRQKFFPYWIEKPGKFKKVLMVRPTEYLPTESGDYTVEIICKNNGVTSIFPKLLMFKSSYQQWSGLEEGEEVSFWYDEQN